MSRTLFSYIFRDLVKVFFLASGALAGIMSFGGLLRPFQEHGLDGSQVVSILGYLMPAMTTYSLPVAALFATTFVYGRLSSDNELTACRAAGMSYAAVIFPALVLGLTVASASLALLCFVVPAATLQVERTIFGNLAGLVATQIQRTRQLDFDAGSSPVTLYAQTATVLPTETAPEGAPGGSAGQSAARQQAVRLGNVMIVTYGRGRDRDAKRTPEEVFTAGTATAFFTLPDKETVEEAGGGEGADPVIRISLENGAKIPRTVAGRETQALAAGVGTTLFGPFPVESLVKENPKFMDVRRLHVLLNHPEQGKRVRRVLDDFVAEDQRAAYLGRLAGELNEAGTTRFDAGGDTVQLWRGSAAAGADRSKLELNVPPVGLPTVTAGGVVQADTAAPPPIRFGQWRDGRPVVEATAQGARLRVYPTADGGQMTVVLDLVDADVRAGASGTSPPPPATSPSDAGASVVRTNFEKRWVIDMPPALEKFAARTVPEYLADGTKGPRQVAALYRAATKQANSLTSEIHARLSFAVSCLILVLVGGTLGMLFRSGNFLSAFAVSVVPAIVSIVLIVTGQHVAENVPWNAAPGFDNPLALGIALIWSGNLLVLLFGFGLVWKLGRS